MLKPHNHPVESHGRTALRNGRGTMVDWRYADGRNYLPPDDVVRTLRPQT